MTNISGKMIDIIRKKVKGFGRSSLYSEDAGYISSPEDVRQKTDIRFKLYDSEKEKVFVVLNAQRSRFCVIMQKNEGNEIKEYGIDDDEINEILQDMFRQGKYVLRYNKTVVTRTRFL